MLGSHNMPLWLQLSCFALGTCWFYHAEDVNLESLETQVGDIADKHEQLLEALERSRKKLTG